MKYSKIKIANFVTFLSQNDKIATKISLNEYIINNPNKLEVKNKLLEFYQLKIIGLFNDIVYTLITPFQLWKLSYKIDIILNNIIENTTYHNDLKYICSKAYIDKKFYENNENISIDNDDKRLLSFKNFKLNNIDWCRFMESDYDPVKINII